MSLSQLHLSRRGGLACVDNSSRVIRRKPLKRCFDLLDVELLPFTLLTANDGTRLERADVGSSQFTAVALNGLVKASKLGHN